MRRILLLCWFCLLGTTPLRAQRSLEDYLPTHREVIQAYLAANRLMSLAYETEWDPRGLEEERVRRDNLFQPYYAVADFNRDGREDFAAVFNSSRIERWQGGRARFNYVCVFHGTAIRPRLINCVRGESAGEGNFYIYEPLNRQLGLWVPDSDGNSQIALRQGRYTVVAR